MCCFCILCCFLSPNLLADNTLRISLIPWHSDLIYLVHYKLSFPLCVCKSGPTLVLLGPTFSIKSSRYLISAWQGLQLYPLYAGSGSLKDF